MTPEEILAAYSRLTPSEKLGVARWIHDQHPQLSPAPARPRFPWRLVFALLLVPTLLISAGIYGFRIHRERQDALARETAAQAAAREAQVPRSPKNLEFLRQHLGREVTIEAVPEAFDVGYLFFHRDRSRGLRLNFFAGQTVTVQSTQLEEWVRSGTKLRVTGTIEENPGDQALEIRITDPRALQIFPPSAP
jgi:hypothetical protein